MNQMGMRPGIILLREGTDTSQGIPQLISNINACQAVADTVQTTLGPAGRDKLIAHGHHNHQVTISNDGATLMRLLEIQHPAAKTLVDISISQDVQVGDGTTSVVLLAAALLTQLKPLIEENVHPQILMRHLQQAGQLAVQTVRQMAVQPEQARETLLKTAATALNSKLISNHQDLFAPMVVNAVTTLHQANALDEMDKYITIKRIPGGDVRQSFLVQGGVAFAKTFSYAGFEQMTKRFAPAKVLLLNVELELKAEKENAEVRISSPEEYQAIVDAEWQVIFEKLERCVETGANVVLSKLPIGDLATQYFGDRGMFCAGRVPDADLKRVAKATGGSIQTTTTQGLSAAILGTCGVFEERQVGDARFNVLTECPVPLTSTIVLRGGTEQFIAESERSVHDALEVVKRAIVSKTVVAGGGAVEMHVASILRQEALKIAGKGQLIYMAFAKALEVIPRQLCDNAGFDPTEVLADLRRQHATAGSGATSWYGVDLTNGGTCDTMESGVWEPSDNKIHSLDAATEAACVILSIDETVIAVPSQDPGAQASGMMGGGGGGAPTMSNMMNTAMQTAQSNGPRSGKLAPGVSYMKGRGGG